MGTETKTKREHPISFSAEMVQAILDGRKTQTRRVAKLVDGKLQLGPRSNGCVTCATLTDAGPIWHPAASKTPELLPQRFLDEGCPYGGPGDVLYWANEPIEFIGINSLPGACRQVGTICSLFDGNQREVRIPDVDNLLNGRKVKRPTLGRWRGRWLPIEWARDWRWPITVVRFGRVQKISEEDAIAEGIAWRSRFGSWKNYATGWPRYILDPVESFRTLWDSINAKRGFGWETNPWVWAVTFKRVARFTFPSLSRGTLANATPSAS